MKTKTLNKQRKNKAIKRDTKLFTALKESLTSKHYNTVITRGF